MLRQQTRGNRLYFSSFPVPVLDDPTYVGPEGIPRVLGAGGAAALARKIPSWRWGALPREGPGLDRPLLFPPTGWGRLAHRAVAGWAEISASSFPRYLETAQDLSFLS